ncbi:response regulator transcription factor [Paenibacillus fonticola]|uniref:response regulator transcription factor n=1 Tax=Paenibacillus fonticola TaxID=379896 RepID=UPI00036A7B4A|nr:response regulator transcription factor [Paenibacillus fonticola]
MPNTAALQTEIEQSNLYVTIIQKVKESAHEANGVLFIYSVNAPSYLESQISGILESQPGVTFAMWSGHQPGSIAVLLPGQTLDTVHFQGLLLKQRIQEINGDLELHMALSSFPEQGELNEQLLKQMEESAKLSPAGDIHIFTKEEFQPSQTRILIVEGDATVREFLQIRLQMQGYETAVTDNGISALELIESWNPDLVLTELNLYGIDGLPYIHHIQQLNVKTVPKIVVLTEQRVEQTISLCFKSGIDDYITKPFSPVELDARIRRCIH